MLTLRTALPTPKYESGPAEGVLSASALRRARAAGVQSAGFTSFLPIVMRGGIWAVDIAGQNQQPSETHTAKHAVIHRVTSGEAFR